MCGQVHCLYSLLPSATNYSLKHHTKGHSSELPRYSYDLSRKRFVLRCACMSSNSYLVRCLCFCVLLLLLFFLFFLRVRLLRVLNKDIVCITINPLMGTSNYSATPNNMKLVHWPLMGGLLHLVQRGGACSPPRPLLAVPNVTAHPSTANVPITVFLHNGSLLCSFNVPIKGLNFLTLIATCL